MSIERKYPYKEKRYQGLKIFQNFLALGVTIEEVIEEALRIARKHATETEDGPWGSLHSWKHFFWSFGNAWRGLRNKKLYNKEFGCPDIAANFPICRVLTDAQIDYVAQQLDIKEVYKAETYR